MLYTAQSPYVTCKIGGNIFLKLMITVTTDSHVKKEIAEDIEVLDVR